MLDDKLQKIGKTTEDATLEDILRVTDLDVMNSMRPPHVTLIDTQRNTRCAWKLGWFFSEQARETQKLIHKNAE